MKTVQIAAAMMVATACGQHALAASKHATIHTPAHIIPASGVLDSADLFAIAHMKKSSDPFGSGDASQYADRQFLITQKVTDLSVRGGQDAYWSYDKVRNLLTISVDGFGGFFLSFGSQDGRGYTGQNAFGIQKHVDVTSEHQTVIKDDDLFKHQIRYTMPLSPDLARAMSSHLGIEVSGVVAKDSVGDVADCRTSINDATIDNPVRVNTLSCQVNVTVTAISFVDTSTATVLHKWLLINADDEDRAALSQQF